MINETCSCAHENSPVDYYMFIEGLQPENGVPQFCSEEPSLSCSEEVNSSVASSVDNQLIVTWNANEVILEGSFLTESEPGNGDHDFRCFAVYDGSANGMEEVETAFVFVRGMYTMQNHNKSPATVKPLNFCCGVTSFPTLPPRKGGKLSSV